MMFYKYDIPWGKRSLNLALMLMLWKTLAVPDEMFNFARLVSEHNKICLNADTRCMSRTNVLIPKYCVTGDYCATCQCDDNCFKYGDCCPDKLIFSNQRPSEDYACVGQMTSSIANPLPEVTRYSYYMIKTCPTDIPNNIDDELKCDNNDLKFSILYPPVTVFETRETYKNQFCAICNDAVDYVTWSVGFSCTYEDVMNALKTVDDFSKLPTCAVYYIPDTDMPVRECLPYIGESVCNATGSWPAYDNFTYQACNMYKNIFVNNGIVYKNLFCFTCNSNLPPLPSDYCAIMFDFTDSGKVSGEFNKDLITNPMAPRDRTPCSYNNSTWFDPYTVSHKYLANVY